MRMHKENWKMIMGNTLMDTWTLETAVRCLGCDLPPAQSWSMFPELNTVISMSSVIMFAILNKSQVHTVSKATTLQSQSIFPKHVKYFNPHPSIVASGLCSYKYIVNTVPNRIPGETSETWIKSECSTNYNLESVHNFHDWMVQSNFKAWSCHSPVFTNTSVAESITEIFCVNPEQSCNGSKLSSCKQHRSRMEVVFLDGEVHRIRHVNDVWCLRILYESGS